MLNPSSSYFNLTAESKIQQGGICMKGNIYCDQKCPVCNKKMKYDPRRGNCFCLEHLKISATGRYRICFGRDVQRRFEDIRQAEQFLNGLRFKTAEGTFDARDYQASNPLGFENLVEKWLNLKSRQNIKPTTLSNLRRDIYRAVEVWGNRNFKTISSGDIEDFLYTDHQKKNGGLITDKTRACIRSTINQFFDWVCKRESVQRPEIPHISFDLNWRNIVTIDQQQGIINEVHRISFKRNPRIWLAISILSHNQNVRPGELIKCAEGDVIHDYQILMVKYPKEGSLKGKQARLNDQELDVIKSFPKALPHTPLFRHIEGLSGVVAGQQFHPKLLNNWWKRACKNLGIEGVTLYPGVKHSTMTAMSKLLSPEQIRRGGSQHASKAMDRYLVPNQHESDHYQKILEKLQGKADVLELRKRKK